MSKGIITAIVVLSLLFTVGCKQIQELRGTSSATTPEVLRTAKLGTDWQMSQMKFEVEAGGELSVMLKLASGDKVDGYFYLEKGKDFAFDIAGNSLIYEIKPRLVTDSERVTSDRFSFTASQEQGLTYALNFYNTADEDDTQKKIAVFLEVIYPVTGSIFVPLKSD
ncbi:MAG: emp24/gp25L/p24 family protein [Chloroflexi bacterium]|nr:emp24/gp25L/p24 family protein [Chloroflexota bacterium]